MDGIGVSGNAPIPEFETDLCETGAAGLPGMGDSTPRVAMPNSRKKGSSL
jgi:hypothetical protein